jgi:tetratricopeptide (TPR) repeat protein
MLHKKGSHDEALEFHQKSLFIKLAALGENHPVLASSYENIGSIWNSIGSYEKAFEYYQKSLEIKLSKFGKSDYRTKESIGYVKEMYQKLNMENEIPDWMNEA